MNQVEKIKELQSLGFFDKNTLSQFFELSNNSLYANIKRWLRSGVLIQLKKGVYVTSEYVKAQKNLDAYVEFLASKLREPSYLSLEYVLQKNNILAESVYGFTSVTLKSKRIYQNKFGIFVYRNIKEKLFQGYAIQDAHGFKVKMATKAKALFDYFYYKFSRIPEVSIPIIEELRLNYDEVSSKDLKELSDYCALSKIRKMSGLTAMIKKIK